LVLLEEVVAAAVIFQTVWKAKLARQTATNLRSDQHRRMIAAAALRIQSAWRGHHVRAGAELRARKEVAWAAKEAMHAAELEQKTKAVVRIQAFARGLGVRRRLKAAVQAARYVDSDEDDEDFAGVDDLLSGLNVVGDFLKAEEPAFMAAATAVIAAQQQQLPPAASSTSTQPLSTMRPPALFVPDQQLALSILPLAASSSGSHRRSNSVKPSAPANVQAWVEAHPGPASPSSTVASQGCRGNNRQWDSSSQVPGSVAEEPSLMMSPTEGTVKLVNPSSPYQLRDGVSCVSQFKTSETLITLSAQGWSFMCLSIQN
jgi:hypothetical protein